MVSILKGKRLGAMQVYVWLSDSFRCDCQLVAASLWLPVSTCLSVYACGLPLCTHLASVLPKMSPLGLCPSPEWVESSPPRLLLLAARLLPPWLSEVPGPHLQRAETLMEEIAPVSGTQKDVDHYKMHKCQSAQYI